VRDVTEGFQQLDALAVSIHPRSTAATISMFNYTARVKSRRLGQVYKPNPRGIPSFVPSLTPSFIAPYDPPMDEHTSKYQHQSYPSRNRW